jgi:hypothetical protein
MGLAVVGKLLFYAVRVFFSSLGGNRRPNETRLGCRFTLSVYAVHQIYINVWF